jgi:hypothetical protein
MPSPKSPQTYGDLYFQPTRQKGDTEESYNERLQEINQSLAGAPAPKLSPGSFTLLTERGANKNMNMVAAAEPTNRTQNEEPFNPGQGTVNFTGETRFDDEQKTLEERKKALLEDIDRYTRLQKNADDADKAVYADLITKKQEELTIVSQARTTLEVAGGDHYVSARPDATFAENPRKMKGGALNGALELVGNIRGKQVGREISIKRAAQIKELQDELSEVRHNAKELLKGSLPQEVRDDLHTTTQFLENALESHVTGNITVPEEDDLLRMRKTIRSVAEGTALEVPGAKTPRGPKEALDAIFVDGNDITVESLVHYGMLEEDAKNLYELLVEDKTIQP